MQANTHTHVHDVDLKSPPQACKFTHPTPHKAELTELMHWSAILFRRAPPPLLLLLVLALAVVEDVTCPTEGECAYVWV